MRAVRCGLAILAVLAVPPAASRAASPNQQLRVLMLMPRLAGAVPVDAAAELEENIRALAGPVVPVEKLADADVLLELTVFHRNATQEGDLEFRWEGHFLSLLPIPGVDHFVPKAEPFRILMKGADQPTKRNAAAALARVLAEAVGRAP